MFSSAAIAARSGLNPPVCSSPPDTLDRRERQHVGPHEPWEAALDPLAPGRRVELERAHDVGRDVLFLDGPEPRRGELIAQAGNVIAGKQGRIRVG
jgi:hypothetical protein